MSTRLRVAPAEYLAMSFADLDREYSRGEIVERSMPDYVHGETQAALNARFWPFRQSHGLFVCSETRMRLAPDLYRIPDVAVFVGRPAESVPGEPALVVVKIISPDDRYSDVLEKLAEYEQWGVANIWVVDPHRRTLAAFRGGALALSEQLALENYPLQLGAELFA